MTDIQKATQYLENTQKNAYMKIGIMPFIAEMDIESRKQELLSTSESEIVKNHADTLNKIQKDNFLETSERIQKLKEKFLDFKLPLPVIDSKTTVQIRPEEFQFFLAKTLSESSDSKYEHPSNAVMVRAVLPCVKKCLEHLQIEYPQNIIISTLPHGEVNAWVKAVPDTNFHLILFQDSWLAFISEALCIFEEYTWSSDMMKYIEWKFLDIDTEEAQSMSDKEKIKAEAIGKFIDLISKYLTNRDLYTDRKPYEHSQERHNHSFYLTRFLPLITFIFGHELGHIHLGHNFESSFKSDILEKWQKEVEADLFGLQVLIAHFREPRNNIELAPYFTAISYFNIIEILEKSESVLQHGNEFIRYSISHPKPVFRKRLILRTISLLPEENQNSVNAIMDATEVTFDSIWEAIKPFLLIMYANGIRPKQMYEDDINKFFKP